MGYEYTPQPSPAPAAAKLKAPAITLIVISSLGAMAQLIRLLFGLGRAVQMPPNAPPEFERVANMLSGPLGVVSVLFGLAVCGFIIFGAMKMMSLQSYGVAMAAAILASIPCISPCCCLDMIPGIWSIVVLMNPEVKAAFR
jgi:hypothetical protein